MPDVSQSVISTWSRLIFIFLTFALSACASKNSATQQADQQQFQSPQAKPLVVESSKGTEVIQPTVVGYQPKQFDDPLESFNRPVFAFNDFLYTYALIPAAKGYKAIMPDPAEEAVSRFFSNLREPLNAINHLAQGEGNKMGSSILRFLINSTIGILGLFDPAKAWFDIEKHKSTLGDTLRFYGVDYGAFLVMPVLGPTDTRSGFSSIVESFVHPINYVTDDPQTTYFKVYSGFHSFTPRAETYEKLSEKAEDDYLFFRNLYLEGLLRDQQYQDTPNPVPDAAMDKPEQLDEQ
ncbi:MlaA family lipoprotein [Neptunicella marina]|uniref:VacJ family lipoprotein n=1 Tax=Neptunicella marina TaxID=2125989 RepID=A0A8J6M859_9ALTE|nr:VacJ family lipoprotein [Neptunicella marina]MBC3767691.1 VacJ family lipoprotein [Neptunicella marina]